MKNEPQIVCRRLSRGASQNLEVECLRIQALCSSATAYLRRQVGRMLSHCQQLQQPTVGDETTAAARATTVVMSLLKHPSAAMTRLTQSLDKSQSEKGGLSVESLPVMKLCVQRHDLESLQCCMKLALCKASCRTYALQAFNWLVRQVTQLECLHDLFWHSSSDS